MIGFSFGGAVICGTLQLMAGGSLDCRTLPSPLIEHQNVRVSLVAPAFERHELNAGGDYEFALSRIDRLVNLYNSSDPVLKRFRFIDDGSPVAAGFLGISARGSHALGSHPTIVQYDCTRSAGERISRSNTIATAQRSRRRCKVCSAIDPLASGSAGFAVDHVLNTTLHIVHWLFTGSSLALRQLVAMQHWPRLVPVLFGSPEIKLACSHSAMKLS